MKIAIDIDDTLTNSFSYFQPFVAEFFGVDVEMLRREGISYSNLPACWKPRELEFCRTYYDRIAAQTPFKPDARRGVDTLRKSGHKIVILTGRTTEFYTDPYLTTREELKNGGIRCDALSCTLDKGAYCAAEGIDLLIDDLPENCAQANAHGIPALLFDSPANQTSQLRCRRVHNWNEAAAAVEQVARGYPDIQTAQQLLEEAGGANPGPWTAHSQFAAQCARTIAEHAGMGAEKGYVLGLLHDVGRRFRIRDLGHIYYGYQDMLRQGYPAVAKICLTHSFPNQTLSLYIGKLDIGQAEIQTVERLLRAAEYDDYDRLIQLCDALASSEGVVDIEQRMEDVRRRYGNYPQAQWDKNVELKREFEARCGCASLYDLLR